jgi:TolB-like protein/Tfp pilus assembly protein PilF
MSLFDELKRRNVFRVGIAYGVTAWLLIQITDILFESIGAPPWVMQAMFIVLGAGFVVTLIFAWAFELTPEGVKRENEVDRSQSIVNQTGRKLDRTIIVILVLALGYFVADKFWLTPARQADPAVQTAETSELEEKGPETIAVLPFVDMSPEGDNEYFSDGLTEELLNILAKIKELQVAGRTSSFAFKGKNEDLRGIGEKLGVKTILEGSVRKDEAGQRVRITAQLVNVENGFHLWSETYDRELKDIFAIQDEIAHEVAAALQITLFGEDEVRITARGVTDLSAYDLYLQGLKNFNEYSFASLTRARADFEKAMQLDPDYLPAQIGYLRSLHQLMFTGAITRKEDIDNSLPLLEKILESDPDNAEAHVLRAHIHGLQSEVNERREQLNLALDTDSRNVDVLNEVGRFIFDLGNTRTGMEYLLEAERIDPYSVSLLWDLCITNAFMLKVETADKYCARIGEVEPENPMRYYGPAMARNFNGELAQSLVLYQKSIELDPDDYELTAAMAQLWTSLGDIEQAETWLRKSEELGSGQPVPLRARMGVHQYREQYGMAADLARRALEKKLDSRQQSQNNFEDTYFLSLTRQGKSSQGLEYFQDKHPEYFGESPEFNLDNRYGAGDLFEIGFLIQLQDPNSEQATEYLNAAETKWSTVDESWFPYVHSINKSSLAVARGQKVQAIEHLFDAFEKNHRLNWRHILTSRMAFSDLQDEPEFKRLISMYEADMDRQRDEAYELLEITP